jgi:hypothetical protein
MSDLRPCRSNASRMGCKRSLEILYVRVVNQCRSSVPGAVAFGVAAHRPGQYRLVLPFTLGVSRIES